MLFPIFTPTTLTGVVTYRAYGPKGNMDGPWHESAYGEQYMYEARKEAISPSLVLITRNRCYDTGADHFSILET